MTRDVFRVESDLLAISATSDEPGEEQWLRDLQSALADEG